MSNIQPLAVRMAVIAGLSHNLVVGSIFGTFSVMIASVEARYGVSPEAAALGIPLIIIVSSVLSPFIGVVAAKYSLRLLLMAGAILSATAFLLLAVSENFLFYVVAYGLCLGPALVLAGSIGPATLVTRWFEQGRGVALGLVHLPIVVAILPVVSNWLLENYGAPFTYAVVAGMIAMILFPMTLLVVDYPNNPSSQPQSVEAVPVLERVDDSLSVAQLLKSWKFWMLTLSASSVSTSAVALGAIVVPMAMSWGIDRSNAALMASVMSLVGIAGSLVFGWVTDRIGGVWSLFVICLDLALLWAVLLIQPSFPILLIVIGLIGMHGAGLVPSLSKSITDSFGSSSFSRGYGLYSLISLPPTVIAILGSQYIFSQTGSYTDAVIAMTGFFGLATMLAFLSSIRKAWV